MHNERYQSDLAISLDDFITSGWKEVISPVSKEGYSAMWQALSSAAHSALEDERREHSKVLWLLADACSMMLSPSSLNEPFKPFAVFDDRRSIIPDDLLDSDIQFFAEIIDHVDDDWLKARLSDLVWLKIKPRHTVYALKAIDAYRSLSLNTETWIHGGRECWQRGIALALMLKKASGDRIQTIENEITTTLLNSKNSDGYLGLWLADLLKTNHLGKSEQINISFKLEEMAHEFDRKGDIHRARDYFSRSADWYKSIPNESKFAEMTMMVAENWVKQAVTVSSSESPSHMSAASFYENAIKIYRTIPRAERPIYQVDDRILELRTHLNNSGEKAIGEMGVIKTPGVDITPLIEKARKSVTGKTVQQALLAFVNLHRGINVESMREGTIERMQKFPLQFLFGATIFSQDGRVIAKRPSISLGKTLSDEDETTIRAEMIRDYGILVNLIVFGDIWPALEVLLREHRLCETDFIDLARNSPFIPIERANLIGKALFAGYERDYVTALHLLIPQVENLVRAHLKQAGAKTTNIDKDGIQNENGMSTLMDLPEAEQVFGKELTFEFKSLFCDSFGPNLRNELAHGLLDENGCNSPFAIYAWWLILKLTVIAWWNKSNPNIEHEVESHEINTEQ